MALKRISHLLFVLLWLSILLLFLYEYYNVKPRSISYYSSSSSSSVSRQPPISRKVLSSKFDFTPFQKQRHRHRHHHSHRHGRSPNMQVQPEPAGTEIDPRYGVEKRLVPTGPNPLHH
ncbi:CLAVATA3/ESR (CLE)-related protein 13 [Vitis vinifera]|uniref:CLAVATA3/ESR (CLE)-related protein 13 n=1 Tax=Vitis vinifera TaxID=29760 RepID=A0A438FYU5_VITVI|nr:CLAVATA3/ESR (CLE)-related protein 13 [Vitis vinifera]